MAELLGTHNYQLDPKGRISLPGRFREALADFYRDRNPDRGPGRRQFTDEREGYFPGRLPCARYAASSGRRGRSPTWTPSWSASGPRSGTTGIS